MSGSYGRFAWFYDKLQRDVPYAQMAKLFDGFIKKYSSENEVVVDLACGTGNLSEKMYRLGYDVIGVDLSQEMLNEALEKKFDRDLDISYLCQSMTELDLMGAADVIICVLDSLNHLDSADELAKTFERVSMFTCDGGLFIFDVNTLYKHRQILGCNSFVYDMEGLMCVWQNELSDDDSVTVTLDFFEEQTDGRYERFTESFREIVYAEEEIDKLLEINGFEILGKYDDFSESPLKDESQRALYVCRRLAR
ncbi:MAG: methyltransferase domain-containing protein [Ruminococcus sp.]|nr:methyltransferase domain-containing protein [Ruminococcus sp.]